MQTPPSSRRHVLRALITGTLVPFAAPFLTAIAAADGTALDTNDPTAKALGYVTASTKPGSSCGNCLQFKGGQGAASGPCALFPGKLVASAGWCLSWMKKPA